MIEHISGRKNHCTNCGAYFHISEVGNHKDCPSKVTVVKPDTIKVSVKAKKSK